MTRFGMTRRAMIHAEMNRMNDAVRFKIHLVVHAMECEQVAQFVNLRQAFVKLFPIILQLLH